MTTVYLRLSARLPAVQNVIRRERE